jgi:hypothetical protein
MCKPISFVSDGKGNFKFFSFLLRKRAASKAGGLRRRELANSFPVDKLDSHAGISEYFRVSEDQVNKYEYDFVQDAVVLDQENARTKDSNTALQSFARKKLRPLVKRLVAKGSDAMLWEVLPHVLSDKSARRLAVFAAEAVLPIFEAKYPKDDRPRKAIEAAKALIEDDTAENRVDASAAYSAAYAAAYAAATGRRCSAASAAYAANAAYAAAYAAAANAAAYAAYAAARARKDMASKIVAEGQRLFNEENRK